MNLSLFAEEDSADDTNASATIIIEHYSLFYVHNLVNKLMTSYHFQLMLGTIPERGHNGSASVGIGRFSGEAT